jgi:hypothetical protein
VKLGYVRYEERAIVPKPLSDHMSNVFRWEKYVIEESMKGKCCNCGGDRTMDFLECPVRVKEVMVLLWKDSYTRTLKVNLKQFIVYCQRAGEVPTNSMHHRTHVNRELCLGRPSSCLIYGNTQINYICTI